jgi:hypothetical protein
VGKSSRFLNKLGCPRLKKLKHGRFTVLANLSEKSAFVAWWHRLSDRD